MSLTKDSMDKPSGECGCCLLLYLVVVYYEVHCYFSSLAIVPLRMRDLVDSLLVFLLIYVCVLYVCYLMSFHLGAVGWYFLVIYTRFSI